MDTFQLHHICSPSYELPVFTYSLYTVMLQGYVVAARTVYEALIEQFPTKRKVWQDAIELEKKHSTSEVVRAMLERATKACPKTEVFWLMWAKECWNASEYRLSRASSLS